jgi:sialate O-acetylesterase
MKVSGPAAADVPLTGPWSYRVGLDLTTAPPKPEPPPFIQNPKTPTGHFNAMVAPVIPYGLRGFVCYLGEADIGRAKEFQSLFPLLIKDWRTRWNLGDVPFLFVQLPNHLQPKAEPGDSAWADLREAQARALREPQTGMAVTIDIGDADDLYPRNKQDVGRRLAQWLLGTTYKLKVVPSGPLYESFAVEGGKIRVKFKNTGQGLVAKVHPLKGFAIAGADLRWKTAEAAIEGGSVVVRCDSVPNPAAVRYAWADNPEGCNLYNKDGLPAAPFHAGP